MRTSVPYVSDLSIYTPLCFLSSLNTLLIHIYCFLINPKMGCIYSVKYGNYYTVYLIMILISSSSQLSSLTCVSAGRKLVRASSEDLQKTLKEDKTLFLRAQIGSRPPTCDRRCSSCPRCEAIQVPTNPQSQGQISKSTAVTISSLSAYNDHGSNYKPMSWKCKCGNLIFNP